MVISSKIPSQTHQNNMWSNTWAHYCPVKLTDKMTHHNEEVHCEGPWGCNIKINSRICGSGFKIKWNQMHYKILNLFNWKNVHLLCHYLASACVVKNHASESCCSWRINGSKHICCQCEKVYELQEVSSDLLILHFTASLWRLSLSHPLALHFAYKLWAYWQIINFSVPVSWPVKWE